MEEHDWGLRLVNEKPIVSFDLDSIAHWEFHYKGKTYKLDVEELLRLLKIVKGGEE